MHYGNLACSSMDRTGGLDDARNRTRIVRWVCLGGQPLNCHRLSRRWVERPWLSLGDKTASGSTASLILARTLVFTAKEFAFMNEFGNLRRYHVFPFEISGCNFAEDLPRLDFETIGIMII